LLEYPYELVAANPTYTFVLVRRDIGEKWILKGSDTATAGQSAMPAIMEDVQHDFVLHPASSYLVAGPKLVAALRNGDLKLLSQRALPGGKFSVTFRLKMEPTLGPNEAKILKEQINLLPAEKQEAARAKLKEQMEERAILEGEMTLDPVLDYAVVEGISKAPNSPGQSKFTRRAHRAPGGRGIVLCDRIDYVQMYDTRQNEGDLTFSQQSTAPVSDAIFYLPHYNFPEPASDSRPPTPASDSPQHTKEPRWLYLIGAALVLVSLSCIVICWRRVRGRVKQ
jgi:hypothetical protein